MLLEYLVSTLGMQVKLLAEPSVESSVGMCFNICPLACIPSSMGGLNGPSIKSPVNLPVEPPMEIRLIFVHLLVHPV